MGMTAARLASLRAGAAAREPPEDAGEDDEFKPTPLMLPTLGVPEVVFSKDPAERAQLAEYNAGLDCETKLIQPGRNVPRLVVTGYQGPLGHQAIVTGVDANGRVDPTIHARAFLAFTEKIVRAAMGQSADRVSLLINQNIAFDFSVIAEDAHQCDILMGKVGQLDSLFEQVMQRIFEMLDLNLIEDTMLRERLIDLAEGTLGKDFASLTEEGNPRRKLYNLKVLTKNYLGVDLDKFTYRMGYGKYLNKPLSDYEPGAVDYLTNDVESAVHVASRQSQRAVLHGLPVGARIPNSAEQSKAAFSLQLVSSWGMRTDLSKVQQLEADLDHHVRQLYMVLKDTGIIRMSGVKGKKAGSQDLKRTHELVEKAYADAGLRVPRTKKGRISTAGSVLEDIALITLRGSSKDVLEKDGRIDETELFKQPLYALSQYVSMNKIKNTYMPTLVSGVRYPINTRFETILETGRISSFKPNLNNIPRGGEKTLLQRLQSRIRQCFVPRPGFVFCSVDYNMLELCTLAQVLLWFFGESKMADAINAGFDLHTLFAAEQLLHIAYEDAVSRKKEKQVGDMRQLAKVGNFGLGGGMGAASLVEFAKATYNVILDIDEAKALKEKWLTAFPEMRAYFRLIGSMMRGYDDRGQPVGSMEQFVSGRIRGRTRYCAMANGFFQGLAADGAKAALYALQKACYLINGPLYGSRVVAFFYDEFLMEHPIETAHERAYIQTDIAIKEMKQVTPDVRQSAAPAQMDCWMKEADTVHSRSGRLISWRPDVKYAKDAATGLMMPLDTSFAA